MKESKTKAYLALNYQAFLDIKNSGEFNMYNCNRVFRIAHAFHNLALSMMEDFVGFNEESFWSNINELERDFGLVHYRKLFEKTVQAKS
ncbi:hypothetical protein PCCS19_01250 [Paenibacillus sp. CCS19]|uniref:hypothetical protein n=1 Tax=Paenibacillus sp. CCS19 TaxID=3158387 RepID=UPI00255DE3D7|nr:hypothetical protein [Paenibacillus cellulosilyticus]GMK37072.1 hypothetical protein PCCS19_01250 [Paenibacillus cellulosilyticus]